MIESKYLTYNAQFNFCCHFIGPKFPSGNRPLTRRIRMHQLAASLPGSFRGLRPFRVSPLKLQNQTLKDQWFCARFRFNLSQKRDSTCSPTFGSSGVDSSFLEDSSLRRQFVGTKLSRISDSDLKSQKLAEPTRFRRPPFSAGGAI